MKKSIVIVIPARLESTRLEKKMLLPIGEHPLLWWSWQNACKSNLAEEIIIATDSLEIFDRMSQYNAKCIMTSGDCQSGTDRVYQAVKNLSKSPDIIVNFQGDEPTLEPEIVDNMLSQFLARTNEFDMFTAGVPFMEDHPEQFASPNNVKVVCNQKNKALYFSRATLACSNLHLGIYAFTMDSLSKFCSLSKSPLEVGERLEQLRALENDFRIGIHIEHSFAHKPHFGVDTQEDLDFARQLLLKS